MKPFSIFLCIWIPALCGAENSVQYPRPIYPATAIVRSGRPAITVVYPAQGAEYLQMAKSIVAAVKKATDVEIPIISDMMVTEKTAPILRTEYRSRNLILLGRLGINRAIWPIYNRFSCAVDGYYPGGDGYVVRTAVNVYNNGANTIIAGGSSDLGMKRAVEQLIAIISTQRFENGSLVLPWQLDVELGGKCREVFERDEGRQLARPFDQPGHEGNPVKRFYENIESYYWSGRKTYLDLGLRYFALIAKDPQFGGLFFGHYAVEFFIRAYRMIDESGLLSPEQVRVGDDLVLKLFEYYGSGYEAAYRIGCGLEAPDADPQKLAENFFAEEHPIANFLSDKALADFILDRMSDTEVTPAIRTEALRRRDNYIAFFDRLLEERWRGDEKGDGSSVVIMGLFRYALEMERYDAFFGTDNARRAALYHLMRMSNPVGKDVSGTDIGLIDATVNNTEYLLFCGIVASYFHDGQFKYIVDTMQRRGLPHYSETINGVHCYRPGPEVGDENPSSLMGANCLPPEPVQYQRLMKSSAGASVPPYEKTFNFATIRGGFKKDDYLLLAGGLDLPGNILVRLALGGHLWLTHTPSMSYYDQNALHITARSEMANLENPAPPNTAQMDCIASLPNAAFIRSTLSDYSGTDWQREIIWLKDGFYIVRDRITALRDDTFIVIANWRPAGGELDGSQWKAVLGDSEFLISPLSVNAGSIEFIEDHEEDSATRRIEPVYRQKMVSSLRKGESMELVNLMQVHHRGSHIQFELRRTNNDGVILSDNRESHKFLYIGPLPEKIGEGDPKQVILSENKLIAFDVMHLNIGNGKPLNVGKPETVEINLNSEKIGPLLASLWTEGEQGGDIVKNAETSISAQLLERKWSFTGAQRPGIASGDKKDDLSERDDPYKSNFGRATRGLLSPPLSEPHTWDLGHVVQLTEICARSGKLPGPMSISVDGSEGSFRPFQGAVVDVDVPAFGEYVTPKTIPKAYQSLRGEPQPARYVRVDSEANVEAHQLLFYDASSPESSEPLRVKVVNLRGDRPDILIYPDVWPAYRDVSHLVHEIFVVDSDGKERWKKTVDNRVLFVKTLDWLGKGNKQIFVGSMDNTVSIYDADGHTLKALAMAGNKNLEGDFLATSVGLWQRDASGRRKIVLPRYHRIGFLDTDGNCEGQRGYRGGFFNNAVLDQGIDYTGDGVEDTVIMGSDELIPITQADIKKEVEAAEKPGVSLLDGETAGKLSGSPVLGFHLWNANKSPLFVARQSMIGIYDLEARRWLFRWVPKTELTAAVALPAQSQLLCQTKEGILWRIFFDQKFNAVKTETIMLSEKFSRMAILDTARAEVVASSNKGILRIEPNNALARLAEGDFKDVDVFPSAASPEGIVAVDFKGKVDFYDLKKLMDKEQLQK